MSPKAQADVEERKAEAPKGEEAPVDAAPADAEPEQKEVPVDLPPQRPTDLNPDTWDAPKARTPMGDSAASSGESSPASASASGVTDSSAVGSETAVPLNRWRCFTGWTPTEGCPEFESNDHLYGKPIVCPKCGGTRVRKVDG